MAARTQTDEGGVLTQASMASMYNTVSVGNDQPTIIISRRQAQYEAYEGHCLVDQIRYTDTDMADGGFQNLLFKGAPITFDDACYRRATCTSLTPSTYNWWLIDDVWFKPTPFVRPTNQDAVFSQLLCYGQLTVSNRSRQGLLYGITNG